MMTRFLPFVPFLVVSTFSRSVISSCSFYRQRFFLGIRVVWSTLSATVFSYIFLYYTPIFFCYCHDGAFLTIVSASVVSLVHALYLFRHSSCWSHLTGRFRELDPLLFKLSCYLFESFSLTRKLQPIFRFLTEIFKQLTLPSSQFSLPAVFWSIRLLLYRLFPVQSRRNELYCKTYIFRV